MSHLTYNAGGTSNFPITPNGMILAANTPQSPDPLNPIPGSPFFAGTTFWSACAGNMLLTVDQRFAWIPFYSRTDKDLSANYATVLLVGVQNHNASSYGPADFTQFPTSPTGIANLQGRPLVAVFFDYTWTSGTDYKAGTMVNDNNGVYTSSKDIIASTIAPHSDTNNWSQTVAVGTIPDLVQFLPDGTNTTPLGAIAPGGSVGSSNNVNPFWPANYSPLTTYGCLDSGSYVIVADDSNTSNWNPNTPNTPLQPSMRPRQISCNGFVYRLAVPHRASIANEPKTTGSDVWELAPGNDMVYGHFRPVQNYAYGTGSGLVRVYVVGRGYNDPANNDTTWSGTPMDISPFVTFIKVK